ncbi:flagellar basal body-associated FliL family protein, partial [Yersinia pestis PY-64]
MSSPCLIIPSR